MNKLESRRWSALVIVVMLVAACTGATASPSPAPASQPPATVAPSVAPSVAAQPFAGETINVSTYSSVTDFDFYKTILPEFETLTGIKVNYVQQPVAAMDQKIPLQLSAKDTSLDVFFTGSENIGSYIGIEGVEPLDAYLDDPAQTPADYDFDDIAPAVQAACQNGGQNWCIASKTGGAVLYYNTRMFEEAGITAPPQSPAELLDYAKRLTTDDHAGFCVRGDKTQNLYAAFMLWQWFYAYDNDVTGNYFDKEWNFLLSEDPNATEFATWYRDITQNAGAGRHLDLPGHELPPGLPAGPRRDVARRLRHDPRGPGSGEVARRPRRPPSGRSPASRSTRTTARSCSRSASG